MKKLLLSAVLCLPAFGGEVLSTSAGIIWSAVLTAVGDAAGVVSMVADLAQLAGSAKEVQQPQVNVVDYTETITGTYAGGVTEKRQRRFWVDFNKQSCYSTVVEITDPYGRRTTPVNHAVPFPFIPENRRLTCRVNPTITYTVGTDTMCRIGYAVIIPGLVQAPNPMPVTVYWGGNYLSTGCNDTSSPYACSQRKQAPRKDMWQLPLPSPNVEVPVIAIAP